MSGWADVGGDRGGREAGASLGSPRGRRMRVITAVCSMSAINWSRPPHRPHASTSNADVRRISSASLYYGLSRPTGDLDVVEVAPHTARLLNDTAGRNSALHRKHKLYVQVVTVAHLAKVQIHLLSSDHLEREQAPFGYVAARGHQFDHVVPFRKRSDWQIDRECRATIRQRRERQWLPKRFPSAV